MTSKDVCLKEIKSLRANHAIERSDENLIAAIHLMNTHCVALEAALDQSSSCGNDHGVDAWYYDEAKRKLTVYQSKLSESKSGALGGLSDLQRARAWLEEVIVDGTVASIPNDNPCLYNLYKTLARVRSNIQRVELCLVSLFSNNELEDSVEYTEFVHSLAVSTLNGVLRDKLGGTLSAELKEYNLVPTVHLPKLYPLERIKQSRIDLRHNAHLDLAYIPLHSLVELYLERGDSLFDKNVRLSLVHKRDEKERLVGPIEDTLKKIIGGDLSPDIFPFYHVGVTIAARTSTSDENDLLSLEAPSIINGCQTITIAKDYWRTLENKPKAIERFKQIKVIAKLVVGTTNEELKEITNANNRQQPIENWQLFSNDPIHIEIEQTLKDAGVFYERQEGKFEALIKKAEIVKHYFNTNGTYIIVVDLGQSIALARGNMQAGAKPGMIFLNKLDHDKVFDVTISRYTKDIVFSANLLKAIKRGLTVYLWQPTLANSTAPTIFQKPLVRAFISRLALLYYYQNPEREWIRREFSTELCKKASPKLVEEMQKFYVRVVSKTKNWYTEESKELTTIVSEKNMTSFFGRLEIELGIDAADGPTPFSPRAIDWRRYEED